MGLDIPATGRVMPDEAYQTHTTEHERDAIDIGLRRAAHLVPTEPGPYVDNEGATWVLDDEGAWTDGKGDRRPPGHSPIIGLLIQKHGPFRPISTNHVTMPVLDAIDTHLPIEKTRTLHVGIARPLTDDLVHFFQTVFPPGAAFANGDEWVSWHRLPTIKADTDVLHVVTVVPDNEAVVKKVLRVLLQHGVPLVTLDGRPRDEVAYLTPTASWLAPNGDAWSAENRAPVHITLSSVTENHVPPKGV